MSFKIKKIIKQKEETREKRKIKKLSDNCLFAYGKKNKD